MVRPQGRTFRITQPHGLRVSYLGMHEGHYNRSNRIVTRYRYIPRPHTRQENNICQERKELLCFDCPKYSVFLLHLLQ
jgi:hypothetical protein